MISDAPTSKAERWILLGAAVYPALLTWGYFLALADAPTPIQHLAYTLGKTFQFVFPLVWVLGVRRESIRTFWGQGGRGLVEGITFGLLAAAAMQIGYRYWLAPTEIFQQAAQALQEKLADTALNTPSRFIALGCFYALVHSFLEEYYWRGFLFGRLRQFFSVGGALASSSIAFTFPHVLVLGYYFGWGSEWTWLFSAAVGVGGAYWAWLYQRAGNLWGAWLGHLLIDAAIFAVGYQMLGW